MNKSIKNIAGITKKVLGNALRTFLRMGMFTVSLVVVLLVIVGMTSFILVALPMTIVEDFHKEWTKYTSVTPDIPKRGINGYSSGD